MDAPVDEDGGRRRKLITIEDVVEALASQCDGARSRDGQGFSRADATEGGRLCAMKRREMAWSADDARRALEIAARYPKQASAILGLGREGREKGILAALRDGRVRLRDPVVERQEPYNYACLSPGGKQVHFWRLAWVADLPGLVADLRAATRSRHGARAIRMTADGRAEITLNGAKRRADRIEIDFNGTTLPFVVEAAARHGFLLEPAVEAPLDVEIDELRRYERAAWVHRGTRDGRKGVWAVFDLNRRHDPFSTDVKTRLRGRFACLEHDDWNWYVDLSEDTAPHVAALVRAHGFAISAELRSALTEAARAWRAKAGAGV